MTTAQAAAELGVSIRRINAMLAAGRLKARRFGVGKRAPWDISAKSVKEAKDRKPGRPKQPKSPKDKRQQ